MDKIRGRDLTVKQLDRLVEIASDL